jgi:hypothetical protein
MFDNVTMGLARRVRALSSSNWNTPGQVLTSPQDLGCVPRYKLLRAFYECNGLYNDVEASMYDAGYWMPSMRPLRNPTYRAVEFYPRRLCPGSIDDGLPIQCENEAVVNAIKKIWKWSNWAAKKEVAARWLALYGDLFINVATHYKTTQDEETDEDGNVVREAMTEPDRVSFELIRPEYVTEMDMDDRGVITYIRADIPSVRRTGDSVEDYMSTWVWNLEGFRAWEQSDVNEDIITDIDRLGDPLVSVSMDEYGIDFIPIVHVAFLDEGNDRGTAAIMPAIDKINEANQICTRLHQMLFRWNKRMLIVSGAGRDANQRPLPPPKVKNSDGSEASSSVNADAEDDAIWSLPGDVTVNSLIPNVDFAAHANALAAMLAEIEKDLPELRYSNLVEEGGASLSGRALRIMLSDTIDKAREVRGNFEAGLVRADEMALTLGKVHGLFDKSIGDYDSGAFEHSFGARDVLPISQYERAETVGAWTNVGVPRDTALRWEGVAQAEIDLLQEEEVGSIQRTTAAGELAKSPGQQAIEQQAVIDKTAREMGPNIDALLQSISDAVNSAGLKKAIGA